MTRTPDEIKKGLECCDCKTCPYDYEECMKEVGSDALAYIQQLETELHQLLTKCERLEEKCRQLERERDALMHWAKGRCDTCAHNGDCVKHDPDPEGLIVHWYDDCEIWEWRGVKEDYDE